MWGIRHKSFKGQQCWGTKWIKEPLTLPSMLIDTCVHHTGPVWREYQCFGLCARSVSNTPSSHRGGPCSSGHSPGSFAKPEEERSLCACVCPVCMCWYFPPTHKRADTHKRTHATHLPPSVLQVKIGDASDRRIILILLVRLWVSSMKLFTFFIFNFPYTPSTPDSEKHTQQHLQPHLLPHILKTK